jgi:hypothetical protein
MSSATLEIIGSYDRRTNTGTMYAPDAHAMVKASTPRKTQIKRGIEECMAIANGLTQAQICENEGKYYISTPKLPLRMFVCKALKRDKTALYNQLLDIQAIVIKAMSDEEVFAKAAEYKSSF